MSGTLEAFIEYITVTKALSKSSIQAYTSDLSSIEIIAKKELIELDSMQVLKLLRGIENRHTLNRKLSALNSFFEFCYKSHFLKTQINFQLSKLPKKLPKFLSLEQVNRGLALIDTSSWIGLRDRALILFLYASGLRVSELLYMKKDDLEDNWLHVRHAKGEKERLVPIAKVALEAMYEYIKSSPFEHEAIWLNYQGKTLSRISAFKITQKYLTVSPHVLRHSYATSLIIGGADLRVVQELLGHSSLNTTQVYTHIQKQNLKETVQTCHPIASEEI